VASREDPPDPLGKRALFWLPLEGDDEPRLPTRRWSITGRAATTGQTTTGKRAFYSTPTGAGRKETAVRPGEDRAHPSGSADRIGACGVGDANGRGLFAVSCSSCGSVTAVGLLELIALHAPFTAFIPMLRFDHWMRCPACQRRTWAGVTLAR
jgi:hypothetical protein